MQEKPKKIIEVFYQCPYCNNYKCFDEKSVHIHMETCTYNYNLPERDCMTCKHKYSSSQYEEVGRAGGHRPIMKVGYTACRKGLSSYRCHIGYNACAYYEKKEGI